MKLRLRLSRRLMSKLTSKQILRPMPKLKLILKLMPIVRLDGTLVAYTPTVDVV